jgi:hypothetical protein
MRLISITPNINFKYKIGSFSFKARILGTEKNGLQISNVLPTIVERIIPTKPTVTE